MSSSSRLVIADDLRRSDADRYIHFAERDGPRIMSPNMQKFNLCDRTVSPTSLYLATKGGSSFWRWEVFRKRRVTPLKSGVAYGTMFDAKQCAETAISAISHTGKMRPQKKI